MPQVSDSTLTSLTTALAHFDELTEERAATDDYARRIELREERALAAYSIVGIVRTLIADPHTNGVSR